MPLLGYGLVQQSRYRLRAGLAEGRLVEVLAEHLPPATPVSLLYPGARQPPPRVRAFVDWARRVFAEADL